MFHLKEGQKFWHLDGPRALQVVHHHDVINHVLRHVHAHAREQVRQLLGVDGASAVCVRLVEKLDSTLAIARRVLHLLQPGDDGALSVVEELRVLLERHLPQAQILLDALAGLVLAADEDVRGVVGDEVAEGKGDGAFVGFGQVEVVESQRIGVAEPALGVVHGHVALVQGDLASSAYLDGNNHDGVGAGLTDRVVVHNHAVQGLILDDAGGYGEAGRGRDAVAGHVEVLEGNVLHKGVAERLAAVCAEGVEGDVEVGEGLIGPQRARQRHARLQADGVPGQHELLEDAVRLTEHLGKGLCARDHVGDNCAHHLGAPEEVVGQVDLRDGLVEHELAHKHLALKVIHVTHLHNQRLEGAVGVADKLGERVGAVVVHLVPANVEHLEALDAPGGREDGRHALVCEGIVVDVERLYKRHVFQALRK